MPLVEIKMSISRHTTAGAKSKGDVVWLPKREADSMIARGQAKIKPTKKEKPKSLEIDEADVF